MSNKFRNPFSNKEITSIEEAINVDIAEFKKLPNATTQFIEGINRLNNIREVLIVTQESNIIGTIGEIANVLRAFQWLNLQDVTLPSTETPRITNHSDVNEENSNGLSASTQWLTDQLNNDQTYKLAVLLVGAIKAQKRIKTEPNLQEILNSQKSLLDTTGYNYLENFEDVKKKFTKELEDSVNNHLDSIRNEADQKLNDIKHAESLKDWQGYYDQLLETKQMVDDKSKPDVPTNPNQERFRDLRDYWKLAKYYYNRKRSRRVGYLDQAKSYKLWKNIWLGLLVFSTITTTLYFKWDTKRWDYENELVQIIGIKFATALLFGSLYVTANKNYRIYSNLIDQIKHRAVVAKTIRSIVLDEKLGEKEEKYKQELVAIAAKAMFELKTVGHLTKKDGSSPLVEIVRDIRT